MFLGGIERWHEMGKTFNNLRCNSISKLWATIPNPILLFTKNLFFLSSYKLLIMKTNKSGPLIILGEPKK